jgi:hypothetical protein
LSVKILVTVKPAAGRVKLAFAVNLMLSASLRRRLPVAVRLTFNFRAASLENISAPVAISAGFGGSESRVRARSD